MQTAYVLKGYMIDANTIQLAESLPFKDQNVQVIIEPYENIPEKKRVPGLWKGQIEMASDFDAPLDDFKEYME